MNRNEEIARVAVIGAGLAGVAAVEAARVAGVPSERILLLERGASVFSGWRAKEFLPAVRPAESAPWQTAEGPLFENAWADALAHAPDGFAPDERGVEKAAEAVAHRFREAGVTVRREAKAVEVVGDAEGNFRVWFEKGPPVATERLIIATGGSPNHAIGWADEWNLPQAERLPAGLNLRLSVSRGRSWSTLAAVPAVVELASVKGAEGVQGRGQLEGAHPWVGGDALSRLSLMLPRALAQAHHSGELRVGWLPGLAGGISARSLQQIQEQAGRRLLAEHPWPEVAPSLWAFILKAARVPPELPWRSLAMRQGQMLANQLVSTRLRFKGYRLDKDAGLVAGGVRLTALVPGTFEVRSRPGLYWVGEGVDLHGLDAGANAWLGVAAGTLAGRAAAASLD